MELGYGQFCTVARAAEVLCERWTPLVVRELLCGGGKALQRHSPWRPANVHEPAFNSVADT
jgi:DNA-binding HxlR family transcriptional regulator